MIVDRIRGLARVPGSRLRAADENFRVHDARQRKVLKGLLAEVGIIGAVLAWVPDDMARAALRSSQDFAAWLAGYDGPLQLVDGHMRAEELKGQAIPVLVADLSRAEAAKALATFDAVGDLAGRDAQKLAALLEDVGRGAEEGTEELLAALRGGEVEAPLPGDGDAEDDEDDATPRVPKGGGPLHGAWRIEHGDAAAVLQGYPDNHFDAVVCDPPYGISFMGKAWDYGLPPIAIWREVLRVLKPGAPVVAFSATRTYHRLAVDIEDAGFEMRDQILYWGYGSGFPKSHDVSKAIDDAAGAVRRVVGHANYSAPDTRTTRAVFASIGAPGGYERMTPTITAPATEAAKQWDGYGTALKPAYEPAVLARKPLDGTVVENVTRWGCGALAIDACRVGTEEMQVTRSDGVIVSENRAMGGANTGRVDAGTATGRWPANVILDESAGARLDAQSGEGDGTSRFFYCAKASRRERDAGLDGFAPETRNTHPTVKPVDLMRYLATLVMPPARVDGPRRLLVPFSGSGSEVIGGLLAGWDDVTGVERDAGYVKIAQARVTYAVANPLDYEGAPK